MEQKTYAIENLRNHQLAHQIEKEINKIKPLKAKIIWRNKKLILKSTSAIPLVKVKKVIDDIDNAIKIEPIIDECEYCNTTHSTHSKKTWPIKDIITSILGLGLAITAFFVIDINFYIGLALYIISYLVLGYEVIIEAVKNIFHGGFLDENFLMVIASIGAFAIQKYPEAIGVMLFYKIGEAFEHYAVSKSRNSITKALDMREETVTIIDSAHRQEIMPIAQVKVGQHLLIKVGERIPLDGNVTRGESFLDTSPITGEPVPMRIKEGDYIYSGCLNTSGVIEMIVEKELSNSMVTRILNSVENATENKPKIDRFITRFSKFYTPIVVGLALVVAIVPSLISGEWAKWITSALTLLVISCPCALVLSVPLAYFSGIGRASKYGILFKGGIALETLTKIKTVVLDKTGTLTLGNFEVQQIKIVNPNYKENDFLSIAASLENNSTHPIAKSILRRAESNHLSFSLTTDVKEISGQGIEGKIKGKIYYLGNAEFMKGHHIDHNYDLEKASCTIIYLSNQTELVGSAFISDTIKPNARKVMSDLTNKGLKTVMLTGDNTDSALMVQKEIGVDEIYTKLLPDEKLLKMQELRKNGPIMYIGDGINDAPVIANADCGAAMGSGTDIAIEASDMVFMNSDLSSITLALNLSQKTQMIAKENIVFALAFKLAILILAFVGFTNLWLAIFADTGVAILCLLNSMRLLRYKMRN